MFSKVFLSNTKKISEGTTPPRGGRVRCGGAVRGGHGRQSSAEVGIRSRTRGGRSRLLEMRFRNTDAITATCQRRRCGVGIGGHVWDWDTRHPTEPCLSSRRASRRKMAARIISSSICVRGLGPCWPHGEGEVRRARAAAAARRKLRAAHRPRRGAGREEGEDAFLIW